MFWDFCFNISSLLIILFLGVYILFLGVFFPKNASFIKLIHKLSAIYIFFSFFIYNFSIVLRPTIADSFVIEKSVETFQRFIENAGINVNENNTENLNFFFDNVNTNFNDLLQTIQNNSLFMNLFVIYAFFMVFIFFFGIVDRFFIVNNTDIEYSLLVFFILLGSLFVFYVHTFLDIILALEVITLASYVLVAFERQNRFSTFGGVQYFILGSIPSGMLLLGAGMLYKNWGTLALEDLDLLLTYTYMSVFNYNFFEEAISLNNTGVDVNNFEFLFKNFSFSDLIVNSTNWELLYVESTSFVFITILAFFLLMFNFLFKVTAAPFHFWAPSVYGNAPIPTVTFLSIFSKGLIFFLIYKVITLVFHGYFVLFTPFFLFCSVLSIFFGMIGAFTETVIKRFFVYSSMSHVGFMLVGLAFFSLEGAYATFHYLPVYILSSFMMWFTLLHFGKENTHLIHFNSLKKSDPLLALLFAFLVFSMSGIPPLGGFFVKLDVMFILLESHKFYLNYVLFIFTVASFYYYLRILKIIFFDTVETFEYKFYKSNIRLWLISIFFLILFFYMFFIQKPLLVLQTEMLASIFGKF